MAHGLFNQLVVLCFSISLLRNWQEEKRKNVNLLNPQKYQDQQKGIVLYKYNFYPNHKQLGMYGKDTLYD